MEMNLYKKIIDEIACFSEPIRSKEIELFHFGESLLHPELHEMVAYGSEKNLHMVLSVNCPHLTPPKADAILAANASKIILSLDGYDAASYRAIRGSSADYSQALKHIDHLLRQHAATSSKTEIVLRMIQLKENMDHGEEYRRKWEKRGVTVDLREFFPWTEKELKDLGEFNRYPPFMPCPFPWEYMAIQWDGSVVPCCRDYNGENILGNVTTQSLQEIWNSKPYEDFRTTHAEGAFLENRICTGCMDMYYSEG